MAKGALGQDSLVGYTLGHYRIVEEIGAGGMGVVYRAYDRHLDRDVAIKILPSGLLANATARQLFHKEAHTLSKLNHPNIATVYDFDLCDGIDYLAEELISGISLDEMLLSAPLSEKEIIDLGTQLCEGLAAAHGRGVLHHDIKPGNLRVTPEGHLKILDFGLAKTLPITGLSGDEQATLSETQVVSGTLPYMSPEQVRNEKLDAGTDIWAAGCVLYEMATGRRPFPGQGTVVVDEILNKTPASPSKLNHKVSPGLAGIIRKCLEKDRGLRYGSAHEIAIDLRRLQAGGLSAALLAVGRKKWSSAKWVGLGLAILIAFCAALFASNMGYWRGRFRGEPGTLRIESLAVLPVKNFSGDPSQEYFADGMTDALIAGLAQIQSVKVISRTSVMHYKQTSETLPHIAAELGVNGIVEASVTRSGSRVRVTAQLIDARQDRHVWANSYEREMTDVLALQSDLVQAIAGEIRAQVTPEESERLKKTRRVDPEVYDATLKATAIFEYATREQQLRQAIDLFQQAVDQDPSYAPAWAGLSDATWTLAARGFEFVAPAEVREKAVAASARALELDPNLPEAHKARADIASDAEWDIDAAQQRYKRAIELRPGYAAAHNFYGQMLTGPPLHEFEEARVHLDRARELDPLSPFNDINLVAWWQNRGDSQKALEEAEGARRRNRTLWVIPWQVGCIRLVLQQPNQAAVEFEAALKLLRPERPGALLGALGLAYGLAGRREDAFKILAEMERQSRSRYVSPSYLAMVYTGLGRRDEAFRLLDLALAQRAPSLIYYAEDSHAPFSGTLQHDPRWKPFRDKLRGLIRMPSGSVGTRCLPARNWAAG